MESCYRQSLTITVINYSGRASELGGIVNLVDWRRSSLSRSERPPFPRAKLITRFDDRSRGEIFKIQRLGNSSREKYPYFVDISHFVTTRCVVCRGEIFKIQRSGNSSREKYPYFVDISHFVTTRCVVCRRKHACQNHPDSFSRFDRTPTCDRQTDRQTDGRTQGHS